MARNTKNTMTNRAKWVKDHYELATIDGGFEARSYGLDPQDGRRPEIADRIAGADRAEVCRAARCRWGHFNFTDEAEAFSRIFR